MTRTLYALAAPTLFVASVFVCPLLARESANDTLTLSGDVTDEAGSPIPNATVTLVAAGSNRWLFDELNPDRGWIESSATNDGRFELGFERSDHRFLVAGDSLVMVRAGGFESQLINVPIARILADAPLRIQLRKSSIVELQLQSTDSKPLANVSVFPASLNGQRIPWCVAKELPPRTTDSSGRVRVDGVSPESIDGVFATSGHQRLEIRRSHSGDLLAMARATRAVQGQIHSTSHELIPGIAEVKMFIVTDPPAKTSFRYLPLQCAWAIAPISESGSFQVDELGLGGI